MNPDSILLIGSGDQASVLREIIQMTLGPIDLRVCGRPGEELEILRGDPKLRQVVLAIGNNFRRMKVVDFLRQNFKDLRFPVLIHPRAVVSPQAKLGPGTVVMAGAVVNPGAVLGSFTVINSQAVVEHDCRIGDYSSLATAAALAGDSITGEASWIGLGARVLQRVEIGAHTVVGAGAVVLESLPDHVIAVGVPARILRTRLEDEPFL